MFNAVESGDLPLDSIGLSFPLNDLYADTLLAA